MSGLHIHFDVSPLLNDLDALANPALVNKATRSVGVYMLQEIQAHFANQTLWDDSAMPQSKAAAQRGGQTLLGKGHLRDSYTRRIGNGIVELGSDLIYAAIHHVGGNVRGHASHIDPRPVLGVSPRNERDIIDEISAVIMGAVA